MACAGVAGAAVKRAGLAAREFCAAGNFFARKGGVDTLSPLTREV